MWQTRGTILIVVKNVLIALLGTRCFRGVIFFPCIVCNVYPCCIYKLPCETFLFEGMLQLYLYMRVQKFWSPSFKGLWVNGTDLFWGFFLFVFLWSMLYQTASITVYGNQLTELNLTVKLNTWRLCLKNVVIGFMVRWAVCLFTGT